MEKADEHSDVTAGCAGRRLGSSGIERFAERTAMALALNDNATTKAIDAAISDHPVDHAVTDAAAVALVRDDS